MYIPQGSNSLNLLSFHFGMHEEIELSTDVSFYEAVGISGLVTHQQPSDLQGKTQMPYSDAGTSN
jgi:hypothetical protein